MDYLFEKKQIKNCEKFEVFFNFKHYKKNIKKNKKLLIFINISLFQC